MRLLGTDKLTIPFLQFQRIDVMGYMVEFIARAANDSQEPDFGLASGMHRPLGPGWFKVDYKCFARLNKDWDEESVYCWYLPKCGKAEARRKAIESREAQLKQIGDLITGNDFHMMLTVKCAALGFDDSLFGVLYSDRDRIKEFAADAVECVLRLAQEKEAA